MSKNTAITIGQFQWIDIQNPTAEELFELANFHEINHHLVKDCLEPEHLPKFEISNETKFLILRSYDENCDESADTIQQVTKKLAVFIKDNLIITIHRREQGFIQDLQAKVKDYSTEIIYSYPQLIGDILYEVVQTYQKPIRKLSHDLEDFESMIFAPDRCSGHNVLYEGYLLKRKSSVYKKMMRLTLEAVSKCGQLPGMNPSQIQDIRETIDRLNFYAEDMVENVNMLVNLHLSIASQKINQASHKTNEVMRVLTVFSIFFLPLNFIVGIYGMNFEIMPELKYEYGYYIVLGMLILVSITIFIWVKSRGWLSSEDLLDLQEEK